MKHPEIDAAFLEKHYLELHESIATIAIEASCTATTIRKKLHKFGIPIRYRRFDDLTGKTIGQWVVLYRIQESTRHIRYWCRCSCGIEKNVSHQSLIDWTSKKCLRCAKPGTAYKHYRWKGCGEISGRKWRQIMYNCTSRGTRMRRGIQFLLSIEFAWSIFLRQERRCALSGLPIRFQTDYKDKEKGTASLDRIDSAGHYTEENVQWVHTDINRMKNHYSQERFLELCRLVVANFA